ncbi:MAG: DNA-binding response regulator, partial [Sulfobacillus thermotolerans]|nr:DNA-binding response regulator [Sulfobacillus thermotolerans]
MESRDQDAVIRVAIVDDHEVVRMGLKNLIDHQPDLRVVGDYATGREAIEHIPHAADVAVLD